MKEIPRISLMLLAFLLTAGGALAQNMPVTNPAGPVISGSGRPIAGALITVCADGATGLPCSPTVTIYKDSTNSFPLTQPIQTDSFGNFSFYVPTGSYEYTITGAVVAPTSAIRFFVGANPGGTNTFTQPQTFNSQIISTVSTGTAPLSVASTTVVPNLNAQLHGGLSAPGSAILGLTDTQAPTNKTLNVGSNSIVETTPSAGKYLRDNGTSFQPSSVAAAGAGGCTNQFPRTLNDNATPSCASVSLTADVSGVLPVANHGTGTPAAGKYVDGGTGAWTALPAGGPAINSVDLTAQGANIASTTILTPGANGFYRASVWCVETRAATTSSTLPAARIEYTDADSSSAYIDQVTATNSLNIVGGTGRPADSNSSIIGPTLSFFAKSGVAIKYSTTGYASSGATSMQYALHIRLEGPF